jgi:hypothetical protein
VRRRLQSFASHRDWPRDISLGAFVLCVE